MAETLADRLRTARERAGLSARSLDKLAGITAGHTSLIESGQRESPAVETVRKLAEALDVSLDWLITGMEHESSPRLDPSSDTGEHKKVANDSDIDKADCQGFAG